MEIREETIAAQKQEQRAAQIRQREAVAKLAGYSADEFLNRLFGAMTYVEEERWRVIARNGRWVVRYEPLNHLELWRDLAEFGTEEEAIQYVRHL
jgi:hypothetical protein